MRAWVKKAPKGKEKAKEMIAGETFTVDQMMQGLNWREFKLSWRLMEWPPRSRSRALTRRST